jgi:hypothetical protein
MMQSNESSPTRPSMSPSRDTSPRVLARPTIKPG